MTLRKDDRGVPCRHDIGWLNAEGLGIYFATDGTVQIAGETHRRGPVRVVMKCNNSGCHAHRNFYFDRTGRLKTIGRIRWSL